MDKCSFDYQNISIGSFTSSLCVTVGHSRDPCEGFQDRIDICNR